MIGCEHPMLTDCSRKVGLVQPCSMSCQITSRKRSSPTGSRTAACVGEFILSNSFIHRKLLGVPGTFHHLNIFDYMKIFNVLGIFIILGIFSAKNIGPYQKSVSMTQLHFALKTFDIGVDSFIVRGANL